MQAVAQRSVVDQRIAHFQRSSSFTFTATANHTMAACSEELYVYSPLPTSTSIRLVRRLETDEDGIINISLETFDLDAAPPSTPYKRRSPSTPVRPQFRCLSYTWGNPHAKGRGFEEIFQSHENEYRSDNLINIKCDGKILRIGKNLHDFLRQPPIEYVHQLRNTPNPKTGKTVLHEAATGNMGTLHWHVGQRVNVNVADNSGRTPLHYASENGMLENVKILLKGGAAVDIKDNNGQTAEDLATANDHHDVVVVLGTARDGLLQEAIQDVPPFLTDSSDVYTWIDAICIDQSNLDERASQVKIMKDIYHNAAYVIVWLGEEDQDTDMAASTISKLVSSAQRYANSDLIPYRNYTPEECKDRSLPYISQEDWNALAKLFLRQWFRRLWVVQEAVFAKGIAMYCGSKQIRWTDLEIVVEVINARARNIGHDPSVIFVPLNEVGSGVEYYFWHISSLRVNAWELLEAPESESSSEFRLQRLTLLLHPFRVTDPRDKIYALMSLAALNSNESLAIHPDYTISAAQCFARFTKLLLTDQETLSPLTFVQDASLKELAGLPSWVPDFSLAGTDPIFSGDFSAAGDLNQGIASFNQHLSWDELSVKGVQFDVVASTAAPRPFDGPNKKLELDSSWFDILVTIAAGKAYEKSNHTLGEILWRTLCADTSLGRRRPAPDKFGQMFRRFLCALICSEPEFKVREKEEQIENSIALVGLLSSAISQQDEQNPAPGPREPDEAMMAFMRQTITPPARDLESEYFDCARHVIPKLEALTKDGNEPCLPTIDEIAEYFASAVTPIRLPDDRVLIPTDMQQFVFSHTQAYGRRRLFASRRGYLALGPVSAEVGDVMCLVPGFKMPVVLRPMDGQRFNFVGEAYVHGIMYGEVATEFHDKDLTEFVLV